MADTAAPSAWLGISVMDFRMRLADLVIQEVHAFLLCTVM